MEARSLSIEAGPVPDRVSIWPIEDGRYGLDATFHESSGYERAEQHSQALGDASVQFSFRQELGDAWTLRFGPLTAADVSRALSEFVT